MNTLAYSKYSSPIFAQRKPNGKLRILVDLQRINHLIKNDYGEHNHPVTTVSDAAQHMAGKKISVNMIVPSPTTAFKWRMSSQSNFWLLILDLVLLLFLDLSLVLTVHFQPSP